MSKRIKYLWRLITGRWVQCSALRDLGMGCSAYATLHDELASLRSRHREAVELLAAQVSDGVLAACRLDHNGNCQEHYVESPCRVAVARTFLAQEPGDKP